MSPILLRQWRIARKRTSLELFGELFGGERSSAPIKDPDFVEENANSRRRKEKIGTVDMVETVHNCFWVVEEFVEKLNSVASVTVSC